MTDHRRRTTVLAVALGPILAVTRDRAALAHEYYTRSFTIIHPWSLPTATDRTARVPVYMKFEQIAAPDRLVGAISRVTASVELVGPDGARVDAIDIPVGPTHEFTADGPHLVLVDLATRFRMGRQYPLTLHFERSGTVDTDISIGDD